MWTYKQSTGELTSPAGLIVGLGYSGHGAGVNNPAMQGAHDVGPIPQGQWAIGHFFDDVGGKGPIVAHLTPAEGTDAYGRSGFMIHGDNRMADHSASHGCIILNHTIRQVVMSSEDRTLEVVA